MDTEKCKVTLDSPENIYFAGQLMKGEICINLTKKTKIRGICFRILGYGKCSWYEILRRDSQSAIYPKGNQRSIIYSSSESYVQHESYILGSKSARPIELEPGSHTYPFFYQLKANLPSSFTGTHGSIKYKLKFIVEKAWNFDDKYSFPITIVKLQPLHYITYNITTAPVLRQMTRNIGVFGGGPISLVAELPRSEAIRGGKLILRVTVDNKSNTHVDKLKFSIRQSVKYFSQQPICIQRDEILKLYKKETGGVQKKSERSFEHELQVPPCQPTDHTHSKIISILYNVQVDLILPGLYKNISVLLPFEVCSHEINVPQVAPTTIVGGSNMYPTQCAPVYPYPISSPSHSVDNNSLSSIENFSSPDTSPSIALPIFPASGPSTLRRDASNRSSISSMYAPVLPSSYPNSASVTPLSHRYPGEQPPSYDQLFGNNSELDESLPSAPPLDMVQK